MAGPPGLVACMPKCDGSRNQAATAAEITTTVATMAAAAPDAHARREELAGLHGIFAGLLPPPGALVALAEAYMFLSYCERPDKHAAKATIHGLMAKALAAAVGRWSFVPVPKAVLNAAAGQMAPELLGSLNVRPAALERVGFQFQDVDVQATLRTGLAT